MRLVHLADLHLGFRQFERLAPGGVNQREADVSATFNVAVDRIIALAPDLVVVGGDVFHYARPSNTAILAAFTGFSRLVAALPGTPVVVASGNHDLSRATEQGSILKLFEGLGIHLADRESTRFYFPDLDVSVLAVPDAPGLARPALALDPRASRNVLVLHGEVQGMLPKGEGGGRQVLEITNDEIGAAAWDYVALGHYHVYRELAPNMYYSGSIDYTSSDPWGEVVEENAAGLAGKGFVERDLVTGAQTFHPLPATRRPLDLPLIDAYGMGAEELNAAIVDAVECGGRVDGRVVRLVVANVARSTRGGLNYKIIRGYKARALNFNLDLRSPDVEAREPLAATYAELRQRPLRSILAERLERRALASDIDREALTTMALGYFDATADAGDDAIVISAPTQTDDLFAASSAKVAKAMAS